LIKRSR